MSDDTPENKTNQNELITDPEEIQRILRTGNPKQTQHLMQRMQKQARQSLKELQLQMQDLVAQVLGFMPTQKQRAKYGKVEHKANGQLIFYWDKKPFLRLDPIKAERVVMRIGDQQPKIRFSQDYEILQDDPVGYKARNPNDNYVVNNYPDD